MSIRAPRCPGCATSPKFTVNIQAFCFNKDCRVLSWDVTEDPAQFKAKAVVVDLGVLGDVLPPGVEVKPWKEEP